MSRVTTTRVTPNNRSLASPYKVLNMSVKPRTPKSPSEYLNAMCFWQTMEKKYLEKRKQLLGEKEKVDAARVAAENARREMGDPSGVQEAIEEMASEATDEEGFADAEDDEFSDVDPECFVDPGAQYYSSLDRNKWMKIRSKLEAVQALEHGRVGREERSFLRGLMLGVFIIATVLVTAITLLTKTLREPEEEYCRHHCNDGPTLTQQLFRAMFPLAHADDEV